MAKKKTAKRKGIELANEEVPSPIAELQMAVAKLAAKVLSAHDRIDKLIEAISKCKKVKGI